MNRISLVIDNHCNYFYEFLGVISVSQKEDSTQKTEAASSVTPEKKSPQTVKSQPNSKNSKYTYTTKKKTVHITNCSIPIFLTYKKFSDQHRNTRP